MAQVGIEDLNRQLLVVGSEPNARGILAEQLTSWDFEVVQAVSGPDAILQGKEWSPAAIVCLWPLRGPRHGLGFLSTMRRHDDRVLIAVAGFVGDVTTMHEVLRAGTNLCWRLAFDGESLAAHLDVEVRRRRTTVASIVHAGDITVDVSGHRAWRGDVKLSLTPTEFQILYSLASHSGQVVSKSALAAECWKRHDDPHGDTDHRIEVHVGSVRKKLHSIGVPILETVYSLGYILRPVEG